MSHHPTRDQLIKVQLMNELWQNVPDRPDYQASNLGRIRSKAKVLQPFLDGEYLCVKVGKKRTVHSIVAAAWLGPRPHSQVIRHGAKGKLDNSVSNLSYGTQAENRQDMRRDGNYPIADNAARRILASNEVELIYLSKESSTVLAFKYGVHPTTIRAIWRGKNWSSVTQHLPDR